MRTRSARGVAVMTVALLALAACSDGDDPTAATETTAADDATTTSAVELNGEPIRLLLPFELGRVITDEDPLIGADAAAEAINRSGGLDGRPVEIVRCDTGDDEALAAACGQQAVDEDMVAVVGGMTFLAGQFLPALEQAQIVSMPATPLSFDDSGSPASYPLTGGIVSVSAGLSGGLLDNGNESIALLYPDQEGAAPIQPFAATGLERFDASFTDEVGVPAESPDMAPFAAAALEGDPDSVMIVLTPQESANLVTEMRSLDPEVDIGTSVNVDPLIDLIGDDAEGLFTTDSTVATTDVENPGVNEYLADMEAIGSDAIGPYSLREWMAVKAFATIAADLPEITAETFWAAVPETTALDLEVMPPVDFSEGGAGGLDRLFNICVLYSRIEDGVAVPINGEFIDAVSGEPCPS